MKKFKSIEFKFAVIQSLIDAGFLKKEISVIEKRIQKGEFDEYFRTCGKDRFYGPHPEIYDYFKNLDLSDELLRKVSSINFEGGNEIYRMIAPNWDGEDDTFQVRTIEDVSFTPNLYELVDSVLLDVKDATPLLQLRNLKTVDVNYGDGIDDEKTISILEKKGVQILNRQEPAKEESGQDSEPEGYTLSEDVKFNEEYEKAQDLIYDDLDPKKALKILEKLIAQRPDDADCWMEKGNAYSVMGSKAEAEKAWMKCIEIDPENEDAYYNLANVKKDKKQYFEAMEFIEKAIENGMKNCPEPWHIKGQLHCLLGDPATGRSLFEKALKMYEKQRKTTEDRGENSFQLACIHSLLGNSKEALEFLKESIDLEDTSIDRAKTEPDFLPIKSNRDFQKLLK